MKELTAIIARISRVVTSLTVIIAVVWPSFSHATVDWSDGFEYASQAALEAVWSSSCPGNSSIITPSADRSFSGGKSLKEVFRGHQNSGVLGPATPGYQSCFIERNLRSSEVVFIRFYVWLDNFVPNPVVTKMTKAFSSVYPNVGMNMFNGNSAAGMAVEGAGPKLDAITMNGAGIPQNRWVCIEAEMRMNTPGVANGVVRNWINGVQAINRTDLLMRGATQNSTQPPNSPNAQFEAVQLYVQDGGVYSGSGTIYTNNVIYYDDYAVSRDARIGCSGSQPSVITPTSTPPSPPTQLIVQ